MFFINLVSKATYFVHIAPNCPTHFSLETFFLVGRGISYLMDLTK